MNKLTPYCPVNCILFPTETQGEGTRRLSSPLTKRQPRGRHGASGTRKEEAEAVRERKRKSEELLQSQPQDTKAGKIPWDTKFWLQAMCSPARLSHLLGEDRAQRRSLT